MEKVSDFYKIEQDFEYVGDDWWKWWIWIEGENNELDNIDHVVYTLHPTFPNPVRTVNDRNTKFKFKASGWGIFTFYAKLFLKNKTEITLSHDLYLEYPDGKANLE